MATYANLFKYKLVVLATFIGAALIIFSPSTGRIFLSDDYCTLNNIVSNNSIWLETFFRPVGDLTLMWNYRLTGWDPFYFYLVNILLHAVNSFLIYLFCLKWYGAGSGHIMFSIAAGLLFLTYPSHSEAILWAIGRGISLAVFFSLLSMIVVISDIKSLPKYLIAGFFYFTALACYESVLLLPVILLVLVHRFHRKQTVPMAIVLMMFIGIHILLRYYLTGGIWRAYNGVIFSKDLIQYLSTFIKVLMRMFIPPLNNPLIFALCGVSVFAILFIILYRGRKIFESDIILRKTLILVVAGLSATIVVALSFGLSTRTSEGDRLLYFPSVFYSILIALLVVRFVGTLKLSFVVVVFIALAQSGLLVVNQRHWNRASEMASKIINVIGLNHQRPLYIVNLPSDHNGAYVFRNCLPEALAHYGIDTANVRVLNIIQSTEIEKIKTLITPEVSGVHIFIWPQTLFEIKNESVVSVKRGSDSAIAVNTPVRSILYWNKNDLIPIIR